MSLPEKLAQLGSVWLGFDVAGIGQRPGEPV
jgi:hypothetical protein